MSNVQRVREGRAFAPAARPQAAEVAAALGRRRGKRWYLSKQKKILDRGQMRGDRGGGTKPPVGDRAEDRGDRQRGSKAVRLGRGRGAAKHDGWKGRKGEKT